MFRQAGEASNAVLVGPKRALIYDTTLRSKYVGLILCSAYMGKQVMSRAFVHSFIDPSFSNLLWGVRINYWQIHLPDVTQGESVSASVDDKFKICKRLASFDVDFIEAGWQGSNPKDAAFLNGQKQT